MVYAKHCLILIIICVKTWHEKNSTHFYRPYNAGYNNGTEKSRDG